LLTLGAAASLYALALLLAIDTSVTALLMRLAAPAGFLAVALCLLSFALRGLRWRTWMRHYHRPLRPLEGLRLYLVGYAFTLTPGNLGEAVRGLLLRRQPLSSAESLSLFGAERLADLICLLLLCAPGIAWLLVHAPEKFDARWSVAAAVVGLAGMLATLLLWRFRHRFFAHFTWMQAAWQCLFDRPLHWIGLTLTAWAAQGVALWLLCLDQSLDIPVSLACGFYAIAMVGGALALLPAGLGGMEFLLTGLLVSQGANAGVALGITLLARVITLWMAVAIGALALSYSAMVSNDICLRSPRV
jgi:glycosyltransferase 2 family protein